MDTLLLYTHDRAVAARWATTFSASRDVVVAAPGELLGALLGRHDGGLVLVDLTAPGTHPDQFRDYCADFPAFRFIAAYAQYDARVGVSLLEAGVRGYCNRYSRDDVQQQVVRVVDAGEVWVGERLMSQLLAAFNAPSADTPANDPLLETLTEREAEVLPLVLEGQPNKVIARDLDISERTVKAHVSSILHKFDVTDRLQLALRFRNPPAVS